MAPPLKTAITCTTITLQRSCHHSFIILTDFDEAGDVNFINMTTYSLQCHKMVHGSLHVHALHRLARCDLDLMSPVIADHLIPIGSTPADDGQHHYRPGAALNHWGRVTNICVGNITIIGSNNGLPPGRRQTIIRSNVGLLLIEPSGRNFGEILIEIYTFLFKKMQLKMSSAKSRQFCLGPNVF